MIPTYIISAGRLCSCEIEIVPEDFGEHVSQEWPLQSCAVYGMQSIVNRSMKKLFRGVEILYLFVLTVLVQDGARSEKKSRQW